MSLSIAVDPLNVSDHVSKNMYGSGIETYNHCMYGGLWSNLLKTTHSRWEALLHRCLPLSLSLSSYKWKLMHWFPVSPWWLNKKQLCDHTNHFPATTPRRVRCIQFIALGKIAGGLARFQRLATKLKKTQLANGDAIKLHSNLY